MPRAPLVLATMLLLACAPPPRVALERARAELDAGRAVRARDHYDAIAARAHVSDAERIDALRGAARACDALGDDAGAVRRLERAVAKDVPGAVEPAEFELAERLRDKDHGRALSLYYRAASGAEKYRGRDWPYQAAMDRIIQISMSR